MKLHEIIFREAINKYTLTFSDHNIEEFYKKKKSEFIKMPIFSLILISFIIVYFTRRVILLIQAYQLFPGSNSFSKELLYTIISVISLALEIATILFSKLSPFIGVPSKILMTFVSYDSMYESFFTCANDRIVYNNLSVSIIVVFIFIGLFLAKSYLLTALSTLISVVYILIFYLTKYKISLLNGIFFPIFILLIYLMILVFFYVFDYYYRMNIFNLYIKGLELKEWKEFFNSFPLGILITKGNNLKFINRSLIHTLNLEIGEGSLFDFKKNHEMSKEIENRLSKIKEKEAPHISLFDAINSDKNKTEDKNYIMSLKNGISEKFFEVIKENVPLGISECQAFVFKEITSLILYKNMVEKEKFLKETFASISHDMRNPIGCIITSLTTLKDMINLNDQEELLSISLSSAELLLCSVNDILDLNQMENNKLKLVFNEFSIKKVLIDCINIMKINFKSKGLFLFSTFDSNIPEVIFSDKNRIKGIFLNFLSNSLKFTRQGGVEINVKMTNDKEKVRISFKDTGKGIEESQQNTIFQKFGKLDGNLTENPTGVGLGLNFSKKVATMLGGDIKFKSKVNQGTKFVVWIPVRGNPDSNENDIVPRRSYTSISSILSPSDIKEEEEEKKCENENNYILETIRPSIPHQDKKIINNLNQEDFRLQRDLEFESPRVLIVDDNESIHFAVKSMLKKYFISCASVYSGEESIEYMKKCSFEESNRGVDVIFMDINMNGGLNGYETTAHLKELMDNKRIKKAVIIGLSGEESNKGNMDEILIKPLRNDVLERIVKLYIK